MTGVGIQTDHEGQPRVAAESVLHVCGATDIGLERERNEDTFVIADLSSGHVSSPCVEVKLALPDSGYLLLVCDGMGGAAAGEVAARIAAGTIKQTLVESGEEVSAHPAEALDDAVAVAHRKIIDEAQGRPQRRGMGTTCTAAILLPGVLTVAQVGDSRAYLLRDGRLWPLTRDQSLATQLLDQGVLTPEQASSHPQRHVLMQALGNRTVKPVITQYDLSPGDRVLLCSDGLHGTISEADIQAALSTSGDLTSTTKALVDQALAAGGDDNVTVVVAEYRGAGPEDSIGGHAPSRPAASQRS